MCKNILEIKNETFIKDGQSFLENKKLRAYPSLASIISPFFPTDFNIRLMYFSLFFHSYLENYPVKSLMILVMVILPKLLRGRGTPINIL